MISKLYKASQLVKSRLTAPQPPASAQKSVKNSARPTQHPIAHLRYHSPPGKQQNDGRSCVSEPKGGQSSDRLTM